MQSCATGAGIWLDSGDVIYVGNILASGRGIIVFDGTITSTGNVSGAGGIVLWENGTVSNQPTLGGLISQPEASSLWRRLARRA